MAQLRRLLGAADKGRGAMQTNIIIPVYDGVNLLDVVGPLEMFFWVDQGQKFRAITVSEDGEAVTSVNGISFLGAEKSRFAHWTGPDAPSVDALWVPGGDPKVLRAMMEDENHPYFRFIREVAERSTWVCSVCEGALLMARAGLLDGYEATTHWAFINCLKGFSKVTVIDGLPRFCVSRNRLTGGGISSGLDEALKLIELMAGTAAAGDVQQTTQYFPDPPVSNPITAIPPYRQPYPGADAAVP
jgi:cyclohexyl-isocyanide hydratase